MSAGGARLGCRPATCQTPLLARWTAAGFGLYFAIRSGEELPGVTLGRRGVLTWREGRWNTAVELAENGRKQTFDGGGATSRRRRSVSVPRVWTHGTRRGGWGALGRPRGRQGGTSRRLCERGNSERGPAMACEGAQRGPRGYL